MFNRSSLLILIAALAGGLGLWAWQRLGAPSAPTAAPANGAITTANLLAVRPFPQPRTLPAFSLRQSDGSELTLDEIKGHWTLVFLGFTHCPDVCPTTLAELAQAQAAWGKLPATGRPRVLFVSVDPGRDSAERTGEYAHYFHPDTLAATADEPALTEFATSLGLVYMKVPGADGDYSMDHSTALVLIDPEGRQAGLVRPPYRPADIASDLSRLTESAP